MFLPIHRPTRIQVQVEEEEEEEVSAARPLDGAV
jgi:hypothetical protein